MQLGCKVQDTERQKRRQERFVLLSFPPPNSNTTILPAWLLPSTWYSRNTLNSNNKWFTLTLSLLCAGQGFKCLAYINSFNPRKTWWVPGLRAGRGLDQVHVPSVGSWSDLVYCPPWGRHDGARMTLNSSSFNSLETHRDKLHHVLQWIHIFRTPR